LEPFVFQAQKYGPTTAFSKTSRGELTSCHKVRKETAQECKPEAMDAPRVGKQGIVGQSLSVFAEGQPGRRGKVEEQAFFVSHHIVSVLYKFFYQFSRLFIQLIAFEC
jgi:hypothetical protein